MEFDINSISGLVGWDLTSNQHN